MIPPYQMGGDAAGAFNKPIPATATGKRDYTLGTISVAESVAVYTAAPTDPLWDVRLNGAHVAYYRAPQGIKVGVPVDWDAPLVVYDPQAAPTGELRVWRAVIDPKALVIDSQGWGLFDPSPCGSGLPIHGWGTGCGLSSDAGLLRGWELKAATVDRLRINHALRIHGPASAAYRLPARKSDQSDAGLLRRTTGLPMGGRLRLVASDAAIMARTAPNGDVALTRFLHAVCFAARDYGLIVCDGADEWLLPIEHRCSDPYVGDLAAHSPTGFLSYALRPTTTATDGFPWGSLGLLDVGVW